MEGLDSRFFGTWRMNQAKSNPSATTVTYEQKGDRIEIRTGDRHYEFKLDGVEAPTDTPGNTMSWKQTGPRTFENTLRISGKVVTTTEREISADGQTMKTRAKSSVTGNNGIETVFHKTSGGSASNPLIGTWKQDPSATKFPNALTFTLSQEPNGIRWRNTGLEFTAAFDGRGYPVSGAGASPGMTASLKRTGARSFDETLKAGDRVMAEVHYELSADGRTITATARTPGAGMNHPSIDVFEKE